MKEAEKAEAATVPLRKRTKRGRGQGHRKKKTKTTSKFPNDPDAEGYEVNIEIKSFYFVKVFF